MNHNTSLFRRVLTLIAVVGASLALLAVGATSASADPYPPQNNCSSSSAGGGNSLNSGAPSQCRGVHDETDRRDNNTNTTRNETETASTGFQTLTASLIAAALLVGGGFLVFAGRRRRHS